MLGIAQNICGRQFGVNFVNFYTGIYISGTQKIRVLQWRVLFTIFNYYSLCHVYLIDVIWAVLVVSTLFWKWIIGTLPIVISPIIVRSLVWILPWRWSYCIVRRLKIVGMLRRCDVVVTLNINLTLNVKSI